MHSHLVTIKVSIERRTHQWMKLNCTAFNKYRLEGLNTKAVQSGSTIKHHRALFNHLGQDVPDFRPGTFYLPAGTLNIMGKALLNQPSHYKGFKEL